MIKKIISRIWRGIKDPVENAIYRFLMRGPNTWGAQAFWAGRIKTFKPGFGIAKFIWR